MSGQGFTRLKSLLKEGVAALRSGVWILEGREAASGEPIRVYFAGSAQQKAYLSSRVFADTCRESGHGKQFFWKLLHALHGNRDRCDIAIIEGSRVHRRLFSKPGDVFIPIWLKTRVDLPLSVSSRSYKEDIRRIRKCGLSYAISSDRDELDAFYHDMYRPSVNASHGDSTIEIGYDSMMGLVGRGRCVLLKVIRDELAIAGALVVTGQSPRLWAIGAQGNNQEHRKCSAYTAAYHFAAEYLAGQGYDTMHMGMSRGFLNDGILQYKNKWDQRVIGVDTTGYILKILTPGAGSDAFLAGNPYVYIDDDRLFGAVFLGADAGDSEKDIGRLRKKYYLAGLSGLKIFRLGEETGNCRVIMES